MEGHALGLEHTNFCLNFSSAEIKGHKTQLNIDALFAL